ncbi:class I SAM-dependent methyltransferase [Pseudodesulfovibrio thermohalotolerans]|uniref:class I SAM-dependent methyltransferase n=1 Tax=Pseudodesulfovibrio thermohalotolerans TaxID=2880651 RepID=UPI0024419FB3|nr:class I SAM-dependent methyltransferase [Pseudodesulfovibrio thermohalotolerans]WFS62491.1 class I SAM-dependent methyltransferase [Pseudodesulfovibrio thermohalotolerans]
MFTEYVPDRNARILDFGCGYGRVMAQLAEAGYTALTGIDFSEPLVRRGREEHPGLDLAAYPGGPLPYADNSFDAAVMLAVFTCMPDTAAQAGALLELKRVLRPGGVLYVNDFLLNRDRRNLDRYQLGQEKYGIYGIFDVDDGGTLRHHDRDHMEALFFDFHTLVFEEAVYDTMHGHLSNGFYAVLRMPDWEERSPGA